MLVGHDNEDSGFGQLVGAPSQAEAAGAHSNADLKAAVAAAAAAGAAVSGEDGQGYGAKDDCEWCLRTASDPLLVKARLVYETGRHRQRELAELVGNTERAQGLWRHLRYHHQRRKPRSMRKATLESRARVEMEGLSSRQWQVLAATSRLGPMTVEHVAELFFDGLRADGGVKSSRQRAASAELSKMAGERELMVRYDLPYRPGKSEPHVAYGLGRVGAEVLQQVVRFQLSDYAVRPAPYNADDTTPALAGPSWRHNLAANGAMVKLHTDARDRPRREASAGPNGAVELSVSVENLWAAWHLTLAHRVPTWTEGGKAHPERLSSVFPDGLLALGVRSRHGEFLAPCWLEYDMGTVHLGAVAEQAWEYLGLAYSGAAAKRLPDLPDKPRRVGDRVLAPWVPLLLVTGRVCERQGQRADRLAARINGLMSKRSFGATWRALDPPPVFVVTDEDLSAMGWDAPARFAHREGLPRFPLWRALIAGSAYMRGTSGLGADHVLTLDRTKAAPRAGKR